MPLDELSHGQRQRLAFIDFSLQYFGEISRQDLISRFATGLAAATRDFALYRELAPDNMQLIHQTKRYHRQPGFKALFPHDPESILHGLAQGFGDGLSHPKKPSEVCFDAVALIHPEPEIVAGVMRAIQASASLKIRYVSTSSGETSREIVPHALVNNGQRWHVRAFDRHNGQFTDFVINRIKTIGGFGEPVLEHERSGADGFWQRQVCLLLIPHPSLKFPEAIELDYGMQEGVLELHCRAALAGYLLRQWSVDCSSRHQISSGVCQLALKNLEVLEVIEHRTIVPGAQSR